jgi:hypothetical protein
MATGSFTKSLIDIEPEEHGYLELMMHHQKKRMLLPPIQLQQKGHTGKEVVVRVKIFIVRYVNCWK